MGFCREEFPCGEAWGHDSETPGYMTAAWNSKDGNRQVVVIVNSHFFSHDEPVSRSDAQRPRHGVLRALPSVDEPEKGRVSMCDDLVVPARNQEFELAGGDEAVHGQGRADVVTISGGTVLRGASSQARVGLTM